MVNTVETDTRLRVAVALARAMAGKKASALKLLNAPAVNTEASAALGMAEAQILYLDGSAAEALEVFDRRIDPFAAQAPIDYKAIAAGNKNTVRFSILDFSAVTDHYKIQDLLRSAGPVHEPITRVTQADEAVSRNEHHEALPLYWNDLLDAYESGTWARQRAAHARMARECCVLGWFAEAISHAIASLDKAAANFVSEHLLHAGDLAALSEGLESLLRCAHLLEHRYVASTIVEMLRDVIPDALFDAVFEWSWEGAQRSVLSRETAERVSASWKALLALIPRASPKQAKAAVELALEHRLYTEFVLQRSVLIQLIQVAFPKLESVLMERVANSCVDLLGSHKHDVDYNDALNLAATIAQNAPATVVEKFADALVPRGTPIANLRLAPLVQLLGRQPSHEHLNRLVSNVVKRLHKQVQRISAGDDADYDLSYIGTLEQTRDEKTIIVFIHGASVELDAIVALCKWVSPQNLRSISEAALDMIDDASNLPTNKIDLIEAMMSMSERLDLDTCQLIVDRLQPHVTGTTVSDWDSWMSGQLSPFKFDMASPADVSGFALYCQAIIAGNHRDGPFVDSVASVVESSLLDSDVRLRRASVAAAGKLPFLPRSVLTQVISSTRDSDSGVATYACAALYDRADLILDESQWEFLATGVRSSLKERNAALRRAAALCIRHLDQADLSAKQRAIVSELNNIVRSDIHFSVRQALAVNNQNSAECSY
jgi:hypothetical protein